MQRVTLKGKLNYCFEHNQLGPTGLIFDSQRLTQINETKNQAPATLMQLISNKTKVIIFAHTTV